ncbi:MAG: ankyrin repeat domain-containing protein [Pirellulaceae bacterium]
MARPRTLKSASGAGDLDAVKYHLSQGADVNATTAAGHFALGAAVINGHSDVVEFLIAQGATNDDGQTALDLAVEEGHASIVRFLKRAMKSSNTGRRTLPLPRPKPNRANDEY